MTDGHLLLFFGAKSGHCEVIDGVFLFPRKEKHRTLDGHLMIVTRRLSNNRWFITLLLSSIVRAFLSPRKIKRRAFDGHLLSTWHPQDRLLSSI